MSATAEMTTAAVPGDPWEMEVGAGGSGGDYVLCPAGNYPANIVAMIDVGHQNEINDKGETYLSRKLVVAYRLTKKRPDGKSFVLAERYTWSMKSNSNFYTLACGVTGQKFKDGEIFNPKSILGICCMVQVANSSGKKDASKTFHNITSVAQFPEGLPCPVVDSPLLAWSVLEGKPLPDVSWIPYVYGDSIPAMVESSKEWKDGKVPRGPANGQAPNGKGGADRHPDDIPF
jgi:hypothetical protein